MEAWSQKDDLTEGMYFLLGEEKGKSREPSSLQMVELIESETKVIVSTAGHFPAHTRGQLSLCLTANVTHHIFLCKPSNTTDHHLTLPTLKLGAQN